MIYSPDFHSFNHKFGVTLWCGAKQHNGGKQHNESLTYKTYGHIKSGRCTMLQMAHHDFPFDLRLRGFAVKIVSRIALAAAVALVSTSAFAQTEERLRQGVQDRDRPAFQAVGVRLGSFLVYPAVDLSVVFDDNLFADATDTEDFYFRVSPEVRVESNFPRHALNFQADLNNDVYFDESSEDRTEFGVRSTGRLDITEGTSFRGDVLFEERREDRGSPDSVGAAADPVEFTRFQGTGELSYRPGRGRLSVGGTYQVLDFDDVALIGGGTQNNDDRDRDVYSVFGRVGYEVSPGYEVFALGLYGQTDYDDPLDDNGVNRDSDLYTVEGGARFELTNVIAGEVSAGYTSEDFDDVTLQTVEGIAANADVEWYVTRLTTILFGASRRVQETTIAGASGYINTVIDVGVDHELMRNVILSAGFRYDNRDYEGITREDDQYEADVRAIYLLNRNLSLAAEYRYETRESTAPTEDYTRNVVGLTLRAQL